MIRISTQSLRRKREDYSAKSEQNKSPTYSSRFTKCWEN